MGTPVGDSPVSDELHPDAEELLALMDEQDVPDFHTLTPTEAREFQRSVALPSPEYEPEPVEAVTDLVVRGQGHGVPVRAYVPEGGPTAGTLVWAHGGGFVLGDVETEDSTARALANASGCVVLSVDYRLAPEHPFPAALEDVLAVTAWANERAGVVGGDPDRVAVGGSSAGGNLAAAATLVGRDRGEPAINVQVLVYPAVNYGRPFDSRDTYDGYFLSLDEMAWFEECYLDRDLHGRNPYAFPLQAGDFGGLPPAAVVTAGRDPLRDEGRAYADELEDAGVEVTHHEYDDVIHAFLGMLDEPEWERAREAVDDVGAFLHGQFDS